MNPMSHPDFVAAEVAYRFERDRVDTTRTTPVRTRPGLVQRLRRMTHRKPVTGAQSARPRRA